MNDYVYTSYAILKVENSVFYDMRVFNTGREICRVLMLSIYTNCTNYFKFSCKNHVLNVCASVSVCFVEAAS